VIFQVETPKFNNRTIDERDLLEDKFKTTNKNSKVEEYLTHKKERMPLFFPHSKEFNIS
jgi:hypothetical protein